MERCFFGRLFGGHAALTCDEVGGVPLRPVMLTSARFEFTMALLCLSQQRRERRDIHGAEPTAGKSRLHLLNQPAVAVRIIECGEGPVAGVIGGRSAHLTARASGLELSAGRFRMVHLAYRYAA